MTYNLELGEHILFSFKVSLHDLSLYQQIHKLLQGSPGLDMDHLIAADAKISMLAPYAIKQSRSISPRRRPTEKREYDNQRRVQGSIYRYCKTSVTTSSFSWLPGQQYSWPTSSGMHLIKNLRIHVLTNPTEIPKQAAKVPAKN